MAGRNRTEKVTLEGGLRDYQDDRLGRPIDMLDMDELQERSTSFTSDFQSFACECEGVSGLRNIDTLFENTVEDISEMVRSDMDDRPYKPGVADNPHNPRFGATTPPAHAGVDNPAPWDKKKYLYPQRRY
jgi:hypothetical protein